MYYIQEKPYHCPLVFSWLLLWQLTDKELFAIQCCTGYVFLESFYISVFYVIFHCSLKIQPSPRIFTYCVLLATTLNNLPRFFEFQLIFDEKGTDYWTSDINEDPRYITMSSYNELITTGVFPLLALCYYNYKIYARMKLSCNIDLGRYVGGKFLLKNIKMHQEGKSISF